MSYPTFWKTDLIIDSENKTNVRDIIMKDNILYPILNISGKAMTYKPFRGPRITSLIKRYTSLKLKVGHKPVRGISTGGL